MQRDNLYDGRHHRATSSTSSSQGPTPGSPTLTNPDMILPDYEVPTSPDDRAGSPLTMWTNANVTSAIMDDYHLPPPNQYARAMPSSTPIIYGNGTMLSDIGEVTEVESNAGAESRRTSSRYSTQTIEGPRHSMMNQRNNAASWATFARERRVSVDSTSTVTTRGRAPSFANVDDNVSVGDSNFQGDDEESMASSYVHGTSPRGAPEAHHFRRTRDVGDDRYSANLISDQAEEILANAKRRLLAMEGNLTRARTSLHSYSDASTPSPGRPISTSQDPKTPPATGHVRIKSEEGIRGFHKPFGPFPQRSASALGSAGGYRPPFLSSRFVGEAQNKPVFGGPLQPTSHALEPHMEQLDEEDDDDDSDPYRNSAYLTNYLSPNFGALPEHALTRSASAAQMRDIQDQMQGLKGKISNLREQAKVDSMKRRSLQSLRTPSPFTHARWDQDIRDSGSSQNAQPEEEEETPTAQYDADPTASHVRGNSKSSRELQEAYAMSPEEGQSVNQSSSDEGRQVTGSGSSSEKILAMQQMVETDHFVGYANSLQNENERQEQQDTNRDEPRNEVGEDDEEGTQFKDASDVRDWESESEASQYHDAYQHAVSHEDREDAFDYQNFFLHSALGSIRRSESRDSYDSEYSDDSIETTRGPATDERRRSLDSIASEESFATAKEGFMSRSSTRQGRVTAMSTHIEEPVPELEGQYEERETGLKNGFNSEIERDYNQTYQHNHPAVFRSASVAAERLHRPSVSSLESTGTTRSFPLINKAKVNGGVLTPGGSPDGLKRISETLLESATAVNERGNDASIAALQNLSREDRLLVERLTFSLGKCVLGLDEASRASTEARQFRRRFEAARRILEGLDEC